MTIRTTHIMAAAVTMVVSIFIFGCTAADDYMEERRAVREEKAEKAKAERAEKAEKAKADAEEAARPSESAFVFALAASAVCTPSATTRHRNEP